MVNCRMKNRRGVAGLISLIGLVVVFGVSSAAYLEITSSQSELINTSIITNQKITERNHEYLNFTEVTAETGPIRYDVTVKNLGGETVSLDSFLIVNGKSIVSKNFLDVSLNADDERIIPLAISSTDPTNDKITIISDTGKKCIFSGDVQFRVC